MKILHLNQAMHGGAAIAVQRLHTALRRDGRVESILGVGCSVSGSGDTIEIPKYHSKLASKILDKVSDGLLAFSAPKGNVFFSSYLFPNNVADNVAALHPDIIHLHWLAGNFISPWELRKIGALGTPVVWTLHDAWAFTGGCHYFGGCYQWRERCRDCPELARQVPWNLARVQWWCKQKAYKQLKPTVVGLSRNFVESIRQSALLADCPVVHLPNCIDSNVFRPIPKETARSLLNLPVQGTYILFGACSAVSDYRKGYDLLCHALRALPEGLRAKVSCLIFGVTQAEEYLAQALPTTFLGFLHDEVTLALAYAAADVFVCPSREESFSQTTLEALACGTPVAAFSVGGIPDMVEHNVSGMLATPHDSQELAFGIARILEDGNRQKRMGEAARRKILQHYDMSVVAQQYIDLYQRLLDCKRHTAV